MSFKAYMTFANEEPKTNSLAFATRDEATLYGGDLHSRWMQPNGYEIRESDMPVSATFTLEHGVQLLARVD